MALLREMTRNLSRACDARSFQRLYIKVSVSSAYTRIQVCVVHIREYNDKYILVYDKEYCKLIAVLAPICVSHTYVYTCI